MRQGKVSKCLFSTLFLIATVMSLFASFRLLGFESTVALLIFDGLFVSLVFLLNGSFARKLSLLALGNLTGLFWNYLLNSFSIAASDIFGQVFRCFYDVLFPFLSSIWIVSFWALSLGVLRRRDKTLFEGSS